MARDTIAALLLIGSLAAWGALHVLVSWKIASKAPRWRGVVALVVPPLAPYWAVKTGSPVWAGLWWLSLAVWGVVRVFFSS